MLLKLIKVGLGPFALVFAWWFFSIIVPQLDQSLQTSIYDGGLGMAIGMFGGCAVWICCGVSWQELNNVRAQRAST